MHTPPAPNRPRTTSGLWLSRGQRRRSIRSLSRVRVALLVLGLSIAPAVAGAGTFAGPASGTSTISGAVFYDANRNGAMDAGEQPISGARVYLVDAAANADVTNMLTDASGRYSFPNLADGSYRVDCDAGLDTNAWVPTTTRTLYGNVSLTLSGPATADFGWRQIERSTTTGSPISLYVGANGLRVESYDDAVSAKDIYDDLVKGALVEPEAQPAGWPATRASGAPISGSRPS